MSVRKVILGLCLLDITAARSASLTNDATVVDSLSSFLVLACSSADTVSDLNFNISRCFTFL